MMGTFIIGMLVGMMTTFIIIMAIVCWIAKDEKRKEND